MQRAALGSLILAAACVAFAPFAHAQSFPPDEDWTPLECGDSVMSDLFQDEAGALAERDIVGDEDAPAGLRASDDEFLYLRLRLDESPFQDPETLRPFAWGMEIDLDGDVTTYEVLAIADGQENEIRLYENTTTTLPNDPADPADEPPVATYAVSTHGTFSVAPGSSYGTTDDWFLSFAIPWADLEPLGFFRWSPMVVWVASSSNANSLNADFACHDGATGDPTLDGTASDETAADPDGDADGDGATNEEEVDAGTDPSDPDDLPTGPGSGDTRLEGGGGCAIAVDASAGLGGWLIFALVGLLLWRPVTRLRS